MAGAQQIVEMVKALQNMDNTVRQKAETTYQSAKQSNPNELILGMMTVLSSPEVEESVKAHDAVLLRQLVTKGSEKDFVFGKLTPQNKQDFAAALLSRYESELSSKLQKKIGNIVSKLADCVYDDAPDHADAWPQLLPLIFRLANTSTATSVESCENSLRLLKDLLSSTRDRIIAAQQELGQIIQNGLQSPELKHKTAVVLLICEIVSEAEKKQWAPLTSTATVMVQVLTSLAQAKEEDLLQECMQAFIEVASVEPDFFKAQLQASMEPANFMATLAREKSVQDSGLRGLAIEWMVSYVEKKNKWLLKSCKNFIPLCVESCMNLLLEVEDDEAALKEWAERMDDEEGAEDEDELFHTGEECIDRVAEAVEMDALSQHLFKLIGHFAAQASWQAKHAALAAVKQTVEYVDGESDMAHVNEMAKLLLSNVEHPHPRVRYTALHGLGQLANDQSPHFQENSHKEVMPILAKMMDDPVDKVAAMAMSAFVSFGEELDNALMAGYARPLMEKLVGKLQTSKHRGVREEAITSIAVIAGVIEKDFSQYYDSIMPMLKQFIMTATGEKENRLRGKSFECMSLLGVAVGKEKFLPDAREAIAAMMNTQTEADDIQKEYIKEASERICTCLKKDFAPFLPSLLPGIFKKLRLQDLDEHPSSQPKDADDDEYVQVSTGDGKIVRVHTQKFEDMMQSVQLLHTFCTMMEGGYFDAIQETAQVLLPLLSASDDMSMLCDEVRGTALQVWGLLINSARLGAQERSQGNDLAKSLLQTGLQAIVPQLLQDNQKDCEVLQELSSGMAECIKNVGAGVLGAEEVKQLTEQIFQLIDQSFVRTQELEKHQQKDKQEASALPTELAGDEDDEDNDPHAEEEQLRRNYEEVLGAMMEVSPNEFMPCLQPVSQKVAQWVAQKETKVLGLYLACDLIQHMKDQSQGSWPLFMPKVFESIGDADPDARTAAAYAINLAASLPAFNEAAPEAFKRVAQVLTGPKPKKKDEKGKVAMDNAVAALLSLAKEKSQLCPPEVLAWDLVLSKLPVKDDEDEAKKVHDKVVELLLAQHPGLVGESNKNLPKVLSILAEVYKQESMSKTEIDDKIIKVFRMLPQNVIMGAAGSFSEKQQRKIEKMLSS